MSVRSSGDRPRPIIAAIVAVSKNGAIGAKNDLLFRIPEDQKFFRDMTLGSPCIMGRKTYESMGRPLPKRKNIVITRRTDFSVPAGVDVVATLEEALAIASREQLPRGEIFIIGGGEIYSLALPMTDRIYLTEIDAVAEGDAYFPGWPGQLPPEFKETKREERLENDPPYRFLTFDRIP